MPNNDYILRSDAVSAFCGNCEGTEVCGQLGEPCEEVKRIKAIPAADVESKQKWVSVEDELPEDYRMVLCYTPVDGYICVGFYRTYNWAGKKLTKWNIVTAMRSTKTLTKKVTHWMPLPEPPKEEKELCGMK